MINIGHTARDLARIADISKVLVRHGFGEVVARLGLRRNKSPEAPSGAPAELESVASADEVRRGDQERGAISAAVRLRLVIEELGPTFVKLGQIASTRPDLVPLDVIAELRKLQDAVPPVAFTAIREQLERSLGASLSELFESIDEHPLAAGSIAQVHRARLRTDEGSQEVVVKVQRPGIVETMASDLSLLHTFAALVERAIPESRIYSPVGLVRQLDHAISNELDFTVEAENALRFSQNFQAKPSLKFPHVYRQASGKQVITLEYLDGGRLNEAVAAGHSGKKLAHIILEGVVKQVFEDGLFHAIGTRATPSFLAPANDPSSHGSTSAWSAARPPVARSGRRRDVHLPQADYAGLADAIYAIGSPTRKIDRHAFEA